MLDDRTKAAVLKLIKENKDLKEELFELNKSLGELPRLVRWYLKRKSIC